MNAKLHIDTGRLLIRNLQPEDLRAFFSYRSNPEVTRYQSFDPMTVEEAEQFIQRQQSKIFGNPGQWIQYGLENKETATIIGDCAIKLDACDVRIAEIGVTISHEHQQKGFAKETLKAILDFLFSIDGFHRVVEIVDAENTASVRLLESVGFRKEGHFIENIFFKGKWGSEFQYAMLRKNWQQANGFLTE